MRGIKRYIRERGAVSYFMRNRRWVTFSICLVASALLWLMITLSAPDGYTKTARVKVIPPDFPPEYIVTDSTDYPDQLMVRIHAPGGMLFKYSLRNLFHSDYQFKPSLDSLALSPNGGEWRLSILELKSQVLAQVFPEVNNVVGDIVQDFIVSPSEVALSYMPLWHQNTEVVFGSQVDYGDRANLRLVDSVEISPSVVQIYGSEERLKSLRSTQPFVQTDTTAIKLSNPGQTSHKIALLAPEGTKLYPDSVTVILTTEELMHYTKVITDISVENLPEGYSLQLLPESVKVTYLIPKIIGTDDEPFPIHLYVDASTVLHNQKRKLDVNIRKIPNNVEMIQLVPDQLEFILTELKKP